MSNSLFTIQPYKVGNQWVFDDPARGLLAEPFVCGAEKVMDFLARGRGTFNLIFSEQPFPGYTHSFTLKDLELGGAWYLSGYDGGFEFWLCPALFKYFKEAPSYIFAKA